MGPPRPSSSQYGSRYSMSRTCGPRDIISLVIPRIGDNNAEPSSFEEADKLQVWKDAMLEEYMSILKNNVWDIVPRPKDK
jgi:hypothetical protein